MYRFLQVSEVHQADCHNWWMLTEKPSNEAVDGNYQKVIEEHELILETDETQKAMQAAMALNALAAEDEFFNRLLESVFAQGYLIGRQSFCREIVQTSNL